MTKTPRSPSSGKPEPFEAIFTMENESGQRFDFPQARELDTTLYYLSAMLEHGFVRVNMHDGRGWQFTQRVLNEAGYSREKSRPSVLPVHLRSLIRVIRRSQQEDRRAATEERAVDDFLRSVMRQYNEERDGRATRAEPAGLSQPVQPDGEK